MTDYMRFENMNPANTVALVLGTAKSDYAKKRDASDVSERFLCLAAQLQEGAFIGWQAATEEDPDRSCTVFSGPGINVSADDFNWIFRTYGAAIPEKTAKLRRLDEGNRRIYRLSCTLGSLKDFSPAGKKDSFSFDSYAYDETASDDCLTKDLLHALKEAKAIVQVCVWAADENEAGHGMILISLPDEMTLRMRSMIALSFPHMAVKEVTELSGEIGDTECFPDEFFMSSLYKLLYIISCEGSLDAAMEEAWEEDADELGGDGEDCEAEDGEYIPIENLDLSIRTHNCLKRNGIYSVEKLQTMTDEELLQLRNFGKKNLSEVRQKLSECRELISAASLGCTNYMDRLDELIGLADVKEQVRKIAAFAKMKKEMAEHGNDCIPIALNMEFVGNPGTAKTTVARIIAGIFHEIGLISSSELIEVGRADLVARYVGQTADQVKTIFMRAKGKILFIDEAYSLIDAWNHAYGDEAISTIVQEMENHRNDTFVIFAGYPDEMKAFFARNPGLRSRVPFSITFPDYSVDEMQQIAEYEAWKRGFSIDAKAKDKVKDICEHAVAKENSGNGRFCRNLVENAILGYAVRVYRSEETAANKDMVLTSDDFPTPHIGEAARKANPFGFRI